ncbi:MAG: sigma-70 family RNA polymerase sigma factor [Polyangiaceae bacterium]|nr:sigma-70 family RNA polymerase sigma factor [Polyangiaceae bacterium]
MSPQRRAITRDVLDNALAGDRSAVRELIANLRPVVQTAVVGVLARSRGSARGRPLAQEVDDFVQEVFARLFASDAKELRRWQPAVAPLETFVRGIAYCDAVSILRNRTTSPYTEDPIEPEQFDPIPKSEPTPETRAISRDALLRLVDAIRNGLGPRGAAVFELLILRERPVEEVCATLAMSEDAVYAWRSRIGKKAREIQLELLSE